MDDKYPSIPPSHGCPHTTWQQAIQCALIKHSVQGVKCSVRKMPHGMVWRVY